MKNGGEGSHSYLAATRDVFRAFLSFCPDFVPVEKCCTPSDRGLMMHAAHINYSVCIIGLNDGLELRVAIIFNPSCFGVSYSPE